MKILNNALKNLKQWLRENNLKQYLLNRLNKINQNLNKKYVKPIRILCIHENNGVLISNMLSDSEITEKNVFQTENELERYIPDNNVQNVITGLCLDKI